MNSGEFRICTTDQPRSGRSVIVKNAANPDAIRLPEGHGGPGSPDP